AVADQDFPGRAVAARPQRYRVAGGEGQRAVVRQRHAVRDQYADVRPDVEDPPRLHREVVREDVTQITRVRADRVERHRLTAADAPGQDIDVLEGQVVVAAARKVLHVAGGQVQR